MDWKTYFLLYMKAMKKADNFQLIITFLSFFLKQTMSHKKNSELRDRCLKGRKMGN